MTKTLKLGAISIAIAIVVFVLKYAAYRMTGSVAILSDALESIVNIAAACAAFLALRVSSLPADDNHPFGHSKAEYLSAVVEGVLIVVAAIAIVHESYSDLVSPKPIETPVLGLALIGLATAINAVWASVLIRVGRRERSMALVADGRHLYTDVVTSGGVILGIALAAATGWQILDPLLALVVALNILWSGWRLIRESVAGLMDEAVAPELLDEITAVIAENGGGAIQMHDLRTRHAGPRTFIEFHLVVDGEMTVAASHAICDRLEGAIRRQVPGSIVTIHVEPESKAKSSGVPVAD